MKGASIKFSREMETKLEKVEKLLRDREYQEALAEIRDFESSHQIDQIPSDELPRFYHIKACVLRFLGSYHDALENATRAFSLAKDRDDSRKIAEIQYILGSIHLSLGDLRNAEIEIRDAQTGFRRESDYRGMITAFNQLAYIESIKGNYSKSVELLYDALRCCDQVEEERYKTILHGELGDRFLMMGKWDKAEENLLLNVELNEKAKDEVNLCRGLLSLGYVYFLKRKFSQACKAYEKTLALIEKNSCVRELAIYHEFSGELAFAQTNYEKALKHYEEAARIGEKIAPDSGIISQTCRLLAELQIAERQHNEALSSCEKALKVATSLGEKIEIGAIHRALGQIYTAKMVRQAHHFEEKEKAKENFEKSISILEQIGAKFELGKTYLEAVKSNAFEYFDRVLYYGNAREIFKELGSDYWLGKVTLAFCEALFDNGQYGEAQVYLTDSEKIFKRLSETQNLDLVLELKGKIDRALGRVGSPETPHQTVYHFSDIVTQDPQMLALIDQARKFKDLDAPILVEGETGTGKDLLAKVIHCESKRKNKRFVKVNCAAIPDTLLESELFGHRKGTFTGADKDKIGFFEEADRGTIFLNEIGDLPLRLQAKILDVIEDKEVTRLGEVQPRKVDFRVIAATNKNLSEEMDKGNFRKDLYHRLNVVKLKLPPLRERKKDIPLLIKHFLADQQVSCEDLDKLAYLPDCLGCHWPGNVRQLANELKRLVSILNPFDLEKLLEELSKLDKTKTEGIAENFLVDKKAEVERTEILEVIKKCDGDKEKASKLLGVSRATLYRKIKDNNLEI